MRLLIIPIAMAISACTAPGNHRSSSNEASLECSKEALLALQGEVHRAKSAFKPLNAAADRNPTEQNTAAASAAVADIMIAEANFEIARDECGK